MEHAPEAAGVRRVPALGSGFYAGARSQQSAGGRPGGRRASVAGPCCCSSAATRLGGGSMREVLDPSTFPGALAYAVLFFGTAAVVARLIRTSVKAATLA